MICYVLLCPEVGRLHEVRELVIHWADEDHLIRLVDRLVLACCDKDHLRELMLQVPKVSYPYGSLRNGEPPH